MHRTILSCIVIGAIGLGGCARVARSGSSIDFWPVPGRVSTLQSCSIKVLVRDSNGLPQAGVAIYLFDLGTGVAVAGPINSNSVGEIVFTVARPTTVSYQLQANTLAGFAIVSDRAFECSPGRRSN
jgi:hypothetical protein